MRRDEEFCREIFECYLRKGYGDESLALLPGSDPPDFVLGLGDEQFAVEVRRIVGCTTVGGRKKEDRAWGAGMRGWFRNLQKEVNGSPWLRGLYVVSMRPVNDLKMIGPTLRKEIIDYIKETSHLVEAPEFRLAGKWRIRKYLGSTTQLTYSHSMGRGRSESEASDELKELVADAVKEKTHKLRKESRRKILLLLDDYHYAIGGAWFRSIAVKEAEAFDAIYRISEEAGCELLWGSDPYRLKECNGRARGGHGCMLRHHQEHAEGDSVR